MSANKLLKFAVVLLMMGEISFFSALSLAAPRDLYFEAEACYRSLRQNPQKIKYRHNWMRCIKKFQSVTNQDPAGPWAAAGLYMSGKMYQQLSKFSGRKSDKKEALDIFERVVKRYPQSRYRQRADREIDMLRATVTPTDSPAKAQPKPETGLTRKDAYINAEACYRELRKNPRKMKYRHNWLRCINKFQAVYDKEPDGPWAPAGLYMAGKLYQKLYAYSHNADDIKNTQSRFSQIINEFPQSRYEAKASLEIQTLPGFEENQTIAKSDPIAEKIKTGEIRQKSTDISKYDSAAVNSAAPTPSAAGGMVTVTDLRFWSNPNYTRVVIDADKETPYYHHLLKKDPSINKPQRLYVDLSRSRLGEHIRKTIPIHDDLLSNARAGQYTHNSVRVVVDIKSFETYKIFSLKDPFRIVIDVWGSRTDKLPEAAGPSVTVKKGGKIPPGSLAKQLALGIRRVVIDPGHGGKDYGAPGYLKGVHEKKIVLQVAKRLAQKIRKDLNLEVLLTRNGDRFLTLEERTALANTKNGDLFISIHTNASRDRRAYGIETYFLNLATDEEAIRVAAMENATSTKNISDLQKILYDLMQNAKINESSRLAAYVQSNVIRILKSKRYSRIKSKGVKQAPFYVLLGAQMPSILIETSFISNPRECKRLVNTRYQERVVEGIVQGIRSYIQATSPTAYRKSIRWTEPQG
jgi:N-acetylmuramoyl-L-alanine amidase